MKRGLAGLIQVQAGEVCWHVLPECREQLLGPDGLRLDEWLRAGQAVVVKHGPHRTVYRVSLPGLRFYLKQYRLSDIRSKLRQLVRPSKARAEYQRALAVAGRDVPTVGPLAVGEASPGLRPGDSFLVTRSLDGTEPLSVFIEHTFPTLDYGRQSMFRQRLAGELAALLARMHEAGMVHADLHPANLLLGLTPDGRPRLHVIDLHAVCLRRCLDWPASRANLVVLNRWFVLRVSRSDRLRFWYAYCRARGIEAGAIGGTDLQSVRPAGDGLQIRPTTHGAFHPQLLRRLARDLERRTWHSNWQFWRSRDRRCLVNNRYYRRAQAAGVSGYAVADLDAGVLAAFLADPDEPFRCPGVVLRKNSPSSTVAEFDLRVGGRSTRVIYKRFRVTTWSDPWAALVRPTPALRSWMYGHGLRERGLPTPRPLAVFHRRRLGLAYEGYLLTEKIADAVDLHGFLAGLDRVTPARRRAVLHETIDRVARLVRALHQRRLSHRDLKAANILVCVEGSSAATKEKPGAAAVEALARAGGFPGLWLIDLVGVKNLRKLSRARRVKNLARLNASFCQTTRLSQTDRLRFLRVYLQWGVSGRATWKRWWQAIAAATRRKVARNRRNGRPLA
jgi:tRNA A-37 threonylcarbamoyl transferase component Bud32